jgi:Mg-chelatase subunit ChlI
MSQLSIKLSDKADALIAQLQKEIFNRRRKKVTAAGVVETLVESGARSQSDKRFATSWVNLIKDIEKAAKLANAHGSKPSALSDAEWAMVLSHRQRTTPAAKAPSKRPAKAKASAAPKKASPKKATSKKATVTASASAKAGKAVTKTAKSTTTSTAAVSQAATKAAKPTSVAATTKPRPAKRARKTTASAGATSVAKRMAKAAGRLGSAGALSSGGISSPARS